jgi:leader peptidase (prepilin peptidase) / N-methyltransferase
MNETLVISVAVALFGLALGSFLNVCIFRIPAGESVISPRSHCPGCGKLIAWYDNIPLVSFFLLGAKCRHCKARISAIYPFVEALTALLLVLCFLKFNLTPEFIKASVLSLLLIILIFTDLTVRRIPHAVTILGMGLGIVLSFVIPVDLRPIDWFLMRSGVSIHPIFASLLGSIAGALAGGGLFYAVGETFYRISGKEGLGFGDVMLMLMVGTFFGMPLTLLTILFGSVLGTLVALPLELFHSRLRHHAWPFGTFLGIGALIAALWGQQAVQAYLNWSGLNG